MLCLIALQRKSLSPGLSDSRYTCWDGHQRTHYSAGGGGPRKRAGNQPLHLRGMFDWTPGCVSMCRGHESRRTP